MRLILGVALGLVVAAGCNNTTTNNNPLPDLTATAKMDLTMTPGGDMAMAPGDMAMAPGDMAMGGPTTHTVNVGQGGINFSPKTLTIAIGDSVKWVWMSSGHNVVSGTPGNADNKFCSPNDLNCGSAPTSATAFTYTHTFAAAGSFPYFCAPHGLAGMTGTITVQ
jgi:plastocyanin